MNEGRGTFSQAIMGELDEMIEQSEEQMRYSEETMRRIAPENFIPNRTTWQRGQSRPAPPHRA